MTTQPRYSGTPGFVRWMERTNGLVAPNDDERYEMMIDRAKAMNSFSADDVLWLDGYLRRNGAGNDANSHTDDAEPMARLGQATCQ